MVGRAARLAHGVRRPPQDEDEPAAAGRVAEYRALERGSEIKHEFVDGHVSARSGGTPEHARLAIDLACLLKRGLEGRPCRVFSSELRVRVEATRRATYPDLTVECGPLDSSPDDPNAVTNPTVLVEVISETSERTDRIERWAHDRRIPNVAAYVRVSQNEPRIESSRRDGTGWIFEEADPRQELMIGGVELAEAIDALYAGALDAPAR